ncbi:MAG: hypothetical protein HQK57_07620 [Deltaproteobacteria bacterium]|nr:hypothetical protein [Deltaproteobacteria bacterium]MBF0526856.1 hypothetical protein [Deltaproteobacteria bacterium]
MIRKIYLIATIILILTVAGTMAWGWGGGFGLCYGGGQDEELGAWIGSGGYQQISGN